MIKHAIVRAASLALGLAVAPFAAKGDLFLSLAPAVDPLRDPPAFGGGASLQLGVNEATDFFLEGIGTGSRGSGDDEDRVETRVLLGSFYTPFFGDIRPRFGGSGGLEYVSAPGGVSDLYFNLGFHLQGLYDASDRFRLFAEVLPNLTFGRANRSGPPAGRMAEFRTLANFYPGPWPREESWPTTRNWRRAFAISSALVPISRPRRCSAAYASWWAATWPAAC
jgi:hypothetical protein